MQVQVRVVRAHVWLSSRSVASEDGFLVLERAVGRTGPASQTVSCGSLEVSELKPPMEEGNKRWKMMSIRWGSGGSEASSAARVVVTLDGEQSIVPVEIVVFMMAKSKAKAEKQRITFVAATSLELSVKDVEAIDGSQEVVFKSPLTGGLGDVEVALRRVDPMSSKGSEEEEQPSGFSVQWTSSEALERDLKRKEQKRLEAEAKLVERLVKVEASAKRVEKLRGEAAELLRRKRAAVVIQRAYRGLRRRRREHKRRLKREQEEKEREKKDAVRAKVVARNQRRTQQLIDAWTKPKGPPVESPGPQNESERSSDWMQRQEEATRVKLRATVARLEAEREAKLAELGCGHQRAARNWGLEDHTGSAGVLSDSLIHAIRSLHVRK